MGQFDLARVIPISTPVEHLPVSLQAQRAGSSMRLVNSFGDEPAAVRIRNGRIAAQIVGGNLPEKFLKKEVK